MAWQDAWNRKDVSALFEFFDEQAVFISVQGPDTPGLGRDGRAGVQAGHEPLFDAMFAESVWTSKQVDVVRFLRPAVAIAHVLWETTATGCVMSSMARRARYFHKGSAKAR